jgi:hypothetical protein
MVLLIEATVLRSQAVFPGAKFIFRISGTGFSITEKTAGEVPAAFV